MHVKHPQTKIMSLSASIAFLCMSVYLSLCTLSIYMYLSECLSLSLSLSTYVVWSQQTRVYELDTGHFKSLVGTLNQPYSR